jgi:hypothetical protein
MFDSNSEFPVVILSGGEKECRMKWPSDADWCSAARRRRVLESSLGNGKSQSRVLGAEAAYADLFVRCRVDTAGPQFDEAEAVAVISKLERCKVISCEREGNAFRVTMRAYSGRMIYEGQMADVYQRVVHLIKMPMQADTLQFSRDSVPPSRDSRNAREIRSYLEPVGPFWAKIGTAEAGYAEGSVVPIVHKDSAINALLEELRQADEGADPEA